MSRIRANKITNQLADGSPTVENGLVISGVTTSTTFSGSGASLTNLNASNIASGTVPTARLGSGTASSSTFLRGDSTFQTVNTDLVSDTSPQLGANLDTNTKCIDFGDSNTGTVNRLRFGASTDLEIFHNGTNNHIDCHTAGQDLYIRPTKDVYIQDYSTDDIHIKMIKDGAVELYHNDSKKIETSNTGAVVTGILTATTFVPTVGQLSHRNLVINGAMNVVQRGQVTGVTDGFGGPDRFRFQSNYSAVTMSQSTDVPTGQGFAKSLKLDVTTAGGDSNASTYTQLDYRFEGQELIRLKYGTSSAETTTLCFWIKSPKAGTHWVRLYGDELSASSGSAFISRKYTVSSANTWQKVTLSFPGYTSDGFNNDNTTGMRISWYFAQGSAYSSGTAQADDGGWLDWGEAADRSRNSVGQVNCFDSTSNDIFLTGVQMEVGTVTTPFEFRSFGDELLRCKRYYQRSTDSSRGTDYSLSTGTWHSADGSQSFSKHNSYYDWKQNFEVEMRVAPTLTIYGSSNQGDIHLEAIGVGSQQVDWNNNTTEVKTKGFLLRHIEDSVYTSGSGNGFGILAYTVDAEL